VNTECEPSDCVESWEFVNCLSDSQLLKDFAPWIYLPDGGNVS
jgi:hypothetical protein